MRNVPLVFEVRCALDKLIRLSQQHWVMISKRKHLEMKGKEKQVEQTLKEPQIVKKSVADPSVCLYYRKGLKYYLVVVVKHQNGEGFVITAYLTKKIKKGEIAWSR